jgi:peptidoglycan/LPS O-acetylase OafA/YrhL
MSGFNAMYHTKNGWRIGVEFFFILSGFLLAYKSSTSKMTAIEFTKHKIARLFPEYFVMILYCIPLKCVLKSMDLKEFVIYIFSSLDDLLFLNGTGIAYNEISGAVWYISALVICGYFIYYLYNKWREVFVSLIAPASVLYIYTFFSRSRGELTGATHITSLNISAALLRGWAGLALGVLAYEI